MKILHITDAEWLLDCDIEKLCSSLDYFNVFPDAFCIAGVARDSQAHYQQLVPIIKRLNEGMKIDAQQMIILPGQHDDKAAFDEHFYQPLMGNPFELRSILTNNGQILAVDTTEAEMPGLDASRLDQAIKKADIQAKQGDVYLGQSFLRCLVHYHPMKMWKVLPKAGLQMAYILERLLFSLHGMKDTGDRDLKTIPIGIYPDMFHLFIYSPEQGVLSSVFTKEQDWKETSRTIYTLKGPIIASKSHLPVEGQS